MIINECVSPEVAHLRHAAMSASGHKRTSRPENSTSALPPKADIGGRELDVRFVPKADIAQTLLDHLVGASEH
jgi:hypothetical protein